MCMKSALLLSALCVGTLGSQAIAKTSSNDVPPMAIESETLNSTDVDKQIALKDMTSPSIFWSHMVFDTLKTSGLDVAASEVSTAELLNKSEEIRVAAVAQVLPISTTNEPNYRLLSGLLIFVSGCMMWMCLTLKRPD